MKFFWKGASIDEDIKRHREREIELREQIAHLEAEPDTEVNRNTLSAYNVLLDLLIESKSEVVNKIGRK